MPITERELKKICGDLYADRESIHSLNPNMSQREAVLWVLYGSLVSLLDVPFDYQPNIPPEAAHDAYFYAVEDLLQQYARPTFDARACLLELSEALRNDER